MSQRTEWKFRYPCHTVRAGANEKAAHHRDREAWWKDELEKAQSELKGSGLQLREVAITGGTRLDPTYDPQMMARVNECGSKEKWHREKAEEYETWARALSCDPNQTVELDVTDVEFFGL